MFTSTVSGVVHTSEITGRVVSSIVTVLVSSIAGFPELSDTLYVTVYDPGREVFTALLSIDTLDHGIVSKLSATLAPGSEYGVPTSNTISSRPMREITGAVVSTISTVLITSVAMFELLSVTLYLTV